MSERPRLPAAITLGVALFFLVMIARDAFLIAVTATLDNQWFWLATSGLVFVAKCTIASGARDLTSRLTAPQRTGVHLVLVALVTWAAWSVLAIVAGAFLRSSDSIETFHTLQSYIYLALGLLGAVGAFIARARGSVAGIVAGILMLVAAVICWPPPALAALLDPPVPAGQDLTKMVLVDAAFLVYYGALWVLLRSAATVAGPANDVPPDATAGLISAAGALTLRLVVAGFGLVLVLFGMLGRSNGLIKFVGIAVPAGNALSLLLFGLGCLRVSRADRAERAAFLIAACASLWVFLISATQTVLLYRMGSEDGNRFLAERATAMAIPQGLLVILSITIALAAAAARARRFGMGDSAQSAVIASYTFIALTLGGLGITRYILPEVRSISGFLFATIVIASLGVFAVLAAIKAFNRIARETEGTPLPVATAKELAPSPEG